MKEKLKDEVKEWVNTTKFSNSLKSAIEDIENPRDKAKLMLEVMSFVLPKIKAEDDNEGDGRDIEIILDKIQDDNTKGDTASSTEEN